MSDEEEFVAQAGVDAKAQVEAEDQARVDLEQYRLLVAREHAQQRRVEEASTAASQDFDWDDLNTGWEDEPASPEVLDRDDGEPMLYLGETHLVAGNFAAGKSWLMAMAVAQEVLAGRPVIYLDWENGSVVLRTRLRQLGIPRAVVAKLVRYKFMRSVLPGPSARRMAYELVADGGRLVVLDALAEVAAGLGRDLSGGDVQAVVETFKAGLEPWAEAGLAVVALDNTTKSDPYSILGAQHKSSGASGATYVVVPREPFSRSKAGFSSVYSVKDRHGGVPLIQDPEVSDHTVTANWFARLCVEPVAFTSRPVIGALDIILKSPATLFGSTLGAKGVHHHTVQEATARVIRFVLDEAGLTKTNSMNWLADHIKLAKKRYPKTYDGAHVDRKYLLNFLANPANTTVLWDEGGLDARDLGVVGSGRRVEVEIARRTAAST